MARISRFTPWLTPREQLEAIFVAREAILDDLVSRALDAARSSSRRHTLLVGSRGSGKTHLVAMAYYRIQDAIDVGAHLRIARLPEDPFTIVSYAHLLGEIVTALEPEGQPTREADVLECRIDQVAATDGPVVVLLENLDEVFAQIGTNGQRRLRHYLQSSTSLLLLATTPVLDRVLNEQTSPFYGFFSTVPLRPLSTEQAQEMLVKMARSQGQKELETKLASARSTQRLEVVKHLAGSQPRLWATFSDVMTPDGIKRVADLLFASFDDLTPYYRDRLMALSPQQRLVVAELADVDRALPVQELSSGTGIPPKSAARTVMELKDSGWIVAVNTPWDGLLDGRKTYYELAEPLVRLAFQVKESINKPIDLIVKFLSVWFDPDELTSWTAGDGACDQYRLEVQASLDGDSTLRLTRRLTRLPDCAADDAALLGQADDAIAQVQAGNAEMIMALPTNVRQALETRWAVESDAPSPAVSVRRDLHRAAMTYMGWTPRQPESSQWIARAENLASTAPGSPEELTIWVEWLARGWLFDQAESIVPLIDDPKWRLDCQSSLVRGHLESGNLGQMMIPLSEQILADSVRALGPDHPDTLMSRNNLAYAYGSAGDLDRAIPLFEQILADSVRVLGPDHPDTLNSRNSLAWVYGSAGDLGRAILLCEQTLTDRMRVLGPDHLDTLISRNNLAFVFRWAGDLDRAIPLFEQTLADSVRVLGPDHPHTLTLRNNLAHAYQSTGDLDRAISLFGQTLTDRMRVLGPDHPDTLNSRNNLAYAYQSAGDLDRAIPLYEQTLADSVRVLGPDHPDTLNSRDNLAYAQRPGRR